VDLIHDKRALSYIVVAERFAYGKAAPDELQASRHQAYRVSLAMQSGGKYWDYCAHAAVAEIGREGQKIVSIHQTVYAYAMAYYMPRKMQAQALAAKRALRAAQIVQADIMGGIKMKYVFTNGIWDGRQYQDLKAALADATGFSCSIRLGNHIVTFDASEILLDWVVWMLKDSPYHIFQWLGDKTLFARYVKRQQADIEHAIATLQERPVGFMQRYGIHSAAFATARMRWILAEAETMSALENKDESSYIHKAVLSSRAERMCYEIHRARNVKSPAAQAIDVCLSLAYIDAEHGSDVPVAQMIYELENRLLAAAENVKKLSITNASR